MKRSTRQYTLRRVPLGVDEALRRRARREGKSLNEIALEALAREAGIDESGPVYTDLDQFIGTWHEDPAFDAALALQRRVDRKLWR
jgi:hypothetical protein